MKVFIFYLIIGYIYCVCNYNEIDFINKVIGTYDSYFGGSVSISGDTVIIGARGDDNYQGSAYVFHKDNSGYWIEEQKLNASDGVSDDLFGSSVSISGDIAIIGSPIDDGAQGSAYVFHRNISGYWVEKQKLTASDGTSDDQFGISVSISGDIAVIGISSSSSTDQGSAYVFHRNNTGYWIEEQKLIASDGAEGDEFGSSVSVDGNITIIGSPFDDDKGSSSGSAYIFHKNISGYWVEKQKLTASDGISYDFFGEIVSISGDIAVIGTSSSTGQGSAYVFHRNGSGYWVEEQKLIASDGAEGDKFGSSVSVSGDIAIIGASSDDTGSAYVFHRNNTGYWVEEQKLKDSYGIIADDFGFSVSVSGDNVVIGTDHYNGFANFYSFCIEKECPICQDPNCTTTSICESECESPKVCSLIGNVSECRCPEEYCDDLLCSGHGSCYFDKNSCVKKCDCDFGWNGDDCGSIKYCEIDLINKVIASDGASDDKFGISVSVSGDFAIIGANGDDDKGSAYVFHRNSTGFWIEEQKLNASDGASGDGFGNSVSISGDFAIIGANGDDDFQGSAYIFHRNNTGYWEEEQKLNASDGSVNDDFGYSVSVDGIIALIGTPSGYIGSAYIFRRSPTGFWVEEQKLTASDGSTNDAFGSSVSISGDFAIIGTPGFLLFEKGSSYVFHRNSIGYWVEEQKLLASDGAHGDYFGSSVSISGDFAIIGAPGFLFLIEQGSAYIFHRNSTGYWEEEQKLTAYDGYIKDNFGSSVSISGDIALIGSIISDTGSGYIFHRTQTGYWVEKQKLTAYDGISYDNLGSSSVSISGDIALIGAQLDPAGGSAYFYSLCTEKECQDTTPTCNGKNNSNPTVCGGKGYCYAPNLCNCTGGFFGSDCNHDPGNPPFYCRGLDGEWHLFSDPEACGPHGKCEHQDKCRCDCKWKDPGNDDGCSKKITCIWRIYWCNRFSSIFYHN